MVKNYYIYEKDPPQQKTNNKKNRIVWKQGYFSFGGQERIANLTALKFITSDIAVIAHRAVAKLYLIKFEHNFCEILHSITLKINGKYYHPDGMDLFKNRVYITTFTAECAIVKIQNNEILIPESTFNVSASMPYHGICIIQKGIFFGGCAPISKLDHPQTCIDFSSFSIPEKKIRFLTGFNRIIKGISDINHDSLLVASDDKTPETKELFHSYIHTYKILWENKTLTKGKDLKLINSQIDGIILNSTKMEWYASVHSADEQCGHILIGSVNNNLELELLSKIVCDNFPHGIDFFNGFIGYTCYGSSSFSICRENELEKIKIDI